MKNAIIAAAAALCLLTGVAHADQATKVTLYAPKGGVAMTILYPTVSPDEKVLTVITSSPSLVSANPLNPSALIVSMHRTNRCASVEVVTTSTVRPYVLCSRVAANGEAEDSLPMSVRKISPIVPSSYMPAVM